MSFLAKDVEKYSPGLTPDKKQKWLATANAALRRCLQEGGDEVECDVSSVRIANNKVEGKDTTLEDVKEFCDKQSVAANDGFDVAMFEADAEKEWQLVFPIGRHYLSFYGEMIFTRRYMEKIVENFTGKAMNKRDPFIDTNHDFGAANGWIKDMRVGEDGVEVRIEWTPRGQALLSNKEYRYFSATIMRHTDIKTGKEFYPTMPAVTLTNIPAMEQMSEARLEAFRYAQHRETEENGVDLSSEISDNITNETTHGDGETEEEGMTFAEIFSAIQSFGEGERAIVANELGFTKDREDLMTIKAEAEGLRTTVTKLEGEKTVLAKVNEDMTKELGDVRLASHEAHKSVVIGKALTELRIRPADKAFWEENFDSNPAFTEQVIEKMPRVVGEPVGTERFETSEEKPTNDDEIVRKNLVERFGKEAADEYMASLK